MHADLRTRIAHEQRRAAAPGSSAWVSANAGSGKTKVLSDRVLRLLLAGIPPGRILCLTFTKAAAANMAIRVFDRLGRWVTLEAGALAADLEELEGERPGAGRLRFARQLFARAVETPGGLKIDTIHAFCERILHLMPFEANVPARFAVLDDGKAREIRDEVTAGLLAAAGEASHPLNAAWTLVGGRAGGEGLDRLIADIVGERRLFREENGPALAIRLLCRRLDMHPDRAPEAIRREMLTGGIPPAEWPAIASALDASPAATDRKRAGALRAAGAIADDAGALAQYRTLFFTAKGGPLEAIVTKRVAPDLAARLLAEQARLVTLDEALKGADAIERTQSLFALAAAIRRGIEAEKARIGALDFDDLIDRTLALLSRGRPESTWALYKLDRGVDHVLVDEAQDTNPEQWQILRRITEEFTAGLGAAGAAARTIFAVGDPKQSIYSFQGADPRRFEESRRYWRDACRDAEQDFQDVNLLVSFRSARAVLSAVDEVFRHPDHFHGLAFADGAMGTVHETARIGVPGHVELWPVERPAKAEDPEAWSHPVDADEPDDPAVVTARRVAEAVRIWTSTGDELGRVWRPGDILILVKKRSAAFRAVIRALRAAAIPVAGADRLDLSEHIAVQDLIAAGRAALLPQDDLTLATVLKSPLIGLSEDDLLRLAAGRTETEGLHDALKRRASGGDGAAAAGLDALASWRALARRHGPFGFYAALLGPGLGRRRLVARLGSEAGDAIDAFLSLARSAEAPDTPSLVTFLARFGASAHEVKRDLEAGGDEVRVMTVHGAKGLEAPVVILIDGCQVYGPNSALLPVVTDSEGHERLPVWAPRKDDDSRAMAQAREAAREREREEHNRLLYVAMTRARDRLVIAPYMTSAKETPEHAWCEMVRRSLTREVGGFIRRTAPYGEIHLWSEDGTVEEVRRDAADPLPVLDPPAWLHAPVPPEPEAAPPIRPSGALGAADRIHRPGDGPSAPQARLVGALVHTLLERLPGAPIERRTDLAHAFVGARAPALSEARRESIVRQAIAVLTDPHLAPLFGPGSRAEAPVAGRLSTPFGDVPVMGQIDRVAVLDDEVLIADFKSTARPPGPGESMPDAYVAQLALYRALMADIHPDKTIRAFLVWTSGPMIRELRDEELSEALSRIGTERASP